MGCLNGGVHDYKLVGDAFICSKCSKVARFKPALTLTEALEKYNTLLEMCHELCEEEINLNDFKVWLENQ